MDTGQKILVRILTDELNAAKAHKQMIEATIAKLEREIEIRTPTVQELDVS